MKIILLFLISQISFAFEPTQMELIELQNRIELYGLKQSKLNIILPDKNYNHKVIDELQNEINQNYIPKLNTYLGECSSYDCLLIKNEYRALLTQKGKVCLPYTQCGFYKCMEEKYQCKKEGVIYFTDLALPTCKQYVSNIKKSIFSQKGHDWIYSVMVCLQKGLIDECEINQNCQKETPKKTCDHITEFTLRFHPGCYLNSGVGICRLPLKDKINIWKTVSPFLTHREREEAYKVILTCIRGGF